jgi:alkanesulfonate monooxygenase SsuD/methylene tetrahydromethanopterin reductase-like flavin-dependent oxidoreductase (luciferase family)
MEQGGFESIFFPEHTHIPTSRQTPYRLGGELPREYSHTIDPIVAMTMAASTTQNLKVATGIRLVIERDTMVGSLISVLYGAGPSRCSGPIRRFC